MSRNVAQAEIRLYPRYYYQIFRITQVQSKLDDEYMRYIRDEREENKPKRMTGEEQKNIQEVIRALCPSCQQQRPTVPRQGNAPMPK